MNLTLQQIAERVGGECFGQSSIEISGVAPAGADSPKSITFAESPKFLSLIQQSHVAAALVPIGSSLDEMSYIQVKSPRLAFYELLHHFHKNSSLDAGIHPTAIIHPSANIDSSASIGPYVCIGKDVQIGPEVQIYPFCYVGDRCQLGPRVMLCPHVTLYQDVMIDAGTMIRSGAVLGEDGFGYHFDGQQHVKISHCGDVRIGRGVEIGANACIDRATCGSTKIGDGTKIDNLVQVGHNCSIGRLNIICGLTGLAGCVTTEDGVVMGGQVAVADHAHLSRGVRIGGGSGVMGCYDKAGDYIGFPAAPATQTWRSIAAVKRLPELLDRVKRLEKLLEEKVSLCNEE